MARVTTKTLTEEMVEQWWREGGRGGSFVDVINASPSTLAEVNRGRPAKNGPIFKPTVEEVADSEQRICDAINARSEREGASHGQ